MKKLLLLFCLLSASLLQAADYPFQVKKSGQGKESIIFIPGYASSGEVWNETVKQFEGHYQCHVLTMPGFAGAPAQQDATIKGWVEAIAAYIKQEKLGKAIIIGHSMGGGMALWLAADYPELVSRVVIVDALPCLAALNDSNFVANPSMDCSSIVTAYTAMDDQRFLQMQRMAMMNLVADTSMRETAVQWSVHSDRATLGRMYCQFINTDLRGKLSNIHCPALVLLEPSFKAVHGLVDAQYHSLSGAQLVYANKGLHFIMYDDKDWYFQQLHDFLQ